MIREVKVNPVDCLSPDGLCIFLFHGVINKNKWEVRNYNNKHLEKDLFTKMIRDLKSNANACSMSMDDVVKYYDEGIKFPPYTYAITFDDGFENNYSIAAPILADHNIPATFYITTDFIDYNEMSWIDKIEQCFEQTKEGALKMPYDVSYDIDTTDRKIEALEDLRHKVKGYYWPFPPAEVAEYIRGKLNIFIAVQDRELDSKMSWVQVDKLRENFLFTIGGHTVTHSILSGEDDMGLEFEIKGGCIEYMEMKLGQVVEHFSYPEGLAQHYNDKVIAVLKDAGVKCCPTAISGVNTNEDLFNLKRIMVA